MRYAFFGTPEFAAIVLSRLIEAGFPPALVVCNPDRPTGRKKIITPPPAKQVVMEQGEAIREQITLRQPEKVGEIEEELRNGNFDLFVIAAYGKIIRKNILDIPKFGTVGVHPSLLPRHRGSSPIQSTILSGDRDAGVTLFLVDELVDHGPILAMHTLEPYAADAATYHALHDALANLGASMLLELLPKIETDMIAPIAQNETNATLTKKFVTEDGFISDEDLHIAETGEDPKKARAIHRMIRALNPEPGVYTIRNGERMKLLDADYENGALVVKRIQMAGGLPQSV